MRHKQSKETIVDGELWISVNTICGDRDRVPGERQIIDGSVQLSSLNLFV